MKSQIDIFDEIIVENFAGGGGASTGIELATLPVNGSFTKMRRSNCERR